MHPSTPPRRPSRLARILPLALLGIALSACATAGEAFISALVPIPEDVAEEMGEFKYVTEQTGQRVHEIFRDEPQLRTRGERLYEATAAAYNPVVERLARSIERGEPLSVSRYRTDLEEAEERRQELIAFMDQNAGGNFVGLEALLARAGPWVADALRGLAGQAVRDEAADMFRSRFRLLPFEQL